MASLLFKLERVKGQTHCPTSNETDSASNKQTSRIITEYGSIIILHGMKPRQRNYLACTKLQTAPYYTAFSEENESTTATQTSLKIL